jgi:hypothetical protein
MMQAQPVNFFVGLHKWARRQDENYLTEAFALLLRHLVDCAPQLAISGVSLLTESKLLLTPSQAESLEVSTQVVGVEGKTDLELATAGAYLIVEIKAQSAAVSAQMDKYRERLSSREEPNRLLALLTHHPVDKPAFPQTNCFVRWLEIAEWLEESHRIDGIAPDTKFLLHQFYDFLRVRNMAIEHVGWEFPRGMRAYGHFLNMLSEVAVSAGLRVRPVCEASWIGVRLNRRDYWAGFWFVEPAVFVIGTDDANVSPDAARKLAPAVGKALCEPWSDNKGYEWRLEYDLDSEPVRFFARSKASQIRFLETCIKEFTAAMAKIQVSTGGREVEEETDDGDADDVSAAGTVGLGD